MKIKFIALSLCMVASVNIIKAQDTDKSSYQPNNRHEFRIAVSDGLTLTGVDILGMGIADAITGTKRSDEKSSMVYGIGYRGDLGFAHTSSLLTLHGESTASIKEKELNFLVLPTAEFVYFKRNLVELYGSAAAGVDLVRHTEKGLTEAGKAATRKADLSTNFAYQVNPIAIRIGNDRVGGFIETGLGYKGFLTAGISLRF